MRTTTVVAIALLSATAARAQPADTPPPAALTGRVTTLAGDPVDGVLVSAARDGSPVTVTVVTGADGRYAFPAGRLAAGAHTLTIRALGFERDGGGVVAVPAAGAATADLRVRPAADVAAQLTSTEWLNSMPGGAEQKRPLIECMSCHTLERVVRSTHSADEFVDVLKRMANYANNTTMQMIQKRVAEREVPDDRARRVGDYLASVNLSRREHWDYPLRTLPRPSGAAQRVIITEYALPRATIAPHDVRTDARGRVWYSNFSEPYIGELDPSTGGHREFAYPLPKPGFPAGALALEGDEDGNWWLAVMFQSGLMKFDPRTGTFRHYPLPPALQSDTAQQSMVMPGRSHVDGKVWSNDVFTHSILRLDVASGAWERLDPFADVPGAANRMHSPYGMAADRQNNLFFMDFGDESVGRVDAATLRATIYPTPTPHSRPRRTMIDASGRVWFAEFAADKLAMFDPGRETIREWDVPTPHSHPYDVYADRNGELWSGSMSDDRVLRFDPATGRTVEYLLPHQTNIRRIFVDDTTSPVTVWVGNNHHASIVRIEPLE